MSYLDAILRDITTLETNVTTLQIDVAELQAIDARRVGVWLTDYAGGGDLTTPSVFNAALRAALVAVQADPADPVKVILIPAGDYTLDAADLVANGPFRIEAIPVASWTFGLSPVIRGQGPYGGTRITVPGTYHGTVFFIDDVDVLGGDTEYQVTNGKTIHASIEGMWIYGSSASAATVYEVRGGLWPRIRNCIISDFLGEQLTGKVDEWRVGTAILVRGAYGTLNVQYPIIQDVKISLCMRHIDMYDCSAGYGQNVQNHQPAAWGMMVLDAAQMGFHNGNKEVGTSTGGYDSGTFAGSCRYQCQVAHIISPWNRVGWPAYTGTALAAVSGQQTITGLSGGPAFVAGDVGSHVTIGLNRNLITAVNSTTEIVVARNPDQPSQYTEGAITIQGGRFTFSLDAPSGNLTTLTDEFHTAYMGGSGNIALGQWMVIDEAVDPANKGIFRIIDIANFSAGATTSWRMVLEKAQGSSESNVRGYIASARGQVTLTLGGNWYTEGVSSALVWLESSATISGRNKIRVHNADSAQGLKSIVRSYAPVPLTVYDVDIEFTRSVSEKLIDMPVAATVSAKLGAECTPRFDENIGVARSAVVATQGSLYSPNTRRYARNIKELLSRRDLIALWDTDHGVNLSGANVLDWTDRIQGWALAPYNAAVYPQYTAMNAKLNNRPSIDFDTAVGASKRSLTIAGVDGSLWAQGKPVCSLVIFSMASVAIGDNRRHRIQFTTSDSETVQLCEQVGFQAISVHTIATAGREYGRTHTSYNSTAYTATNGHYVLHNEPLTSVDGLGMVTISDVGKPFGNGYLWSHRAGSGGTATIAVGSNADTSNQQEWQIALLAYFNQSLSLADFQELEQIIEDTYGIVSTNGYDY